MLLHLYNTPSPTSSSQIKGAGAQDGGLLPYQRDPTGRGWCYSTMKRKKR